MGNVHVGNGHVGGHGCEVLGVGSISDVLRAQGTSCEVLVVGSISDVASMYKRRAVRC